MNIIRHGVCRRLIYFKLYIRFFIDGAGPCNASSWWIKSEIDFEIDFKEQLAAHSIVFQLEIDILSGSRDWSC